MPDAAASNVVPFPPDRPRRRRASRRKTNRVQRGLDFATAWDSWETALHGRNRSEATIQTYRDTITIFTTWLTQEGVPDDVTAIQPEHIQRFLAHENGRTYNKRTTKTKTTRPATAKKHFRNLRAFFNYLIRADELTVSPVHPDDEPHAPDVEKPPLTDDQVNDLLDSCRGKAFENARDEAIIRLLIDSGPRRSGVAGIRYTPDDPDTHDVDLKRYRIRITLKGGDTELVPIGRKTAVALDRYIRARNRHEFADEPWLWIGEHGHFTGSGIYQMLKRRGAKVGMPELHPHRFRRTSVTNFLDAGGTEIDAMHVYGWKSLAMVRHYTKETARQRARDAHARLSPGDRF